VSLDGTHDETLDRTVQVFLDTIARCATPEAAEAMLAAIRSELMRTIGKIEGDGADPAAAEALRQVLARLDRETDGGGEARMSDDERRPLTEEERARIQAAKARGEMCAGCGRALVEGETVWFEQFAIHGEHGELNYWWAPVGAECAAPETVRATCKTEPERCAGCGRGIFNQPAHPRRRAVSCSRRCGVRSSVARGEGTSS